VLLLIVKPTLGQSRHLPRTFSEDFSRGTQLYDSSNGSTYAQVVQDMVVSAVGTEVAMVPYDVHVIRKQLYISDGHERALKARARELGVSEAGLARRLPDGSLLGGE
jgi:hypothetical protein